MKATVRHVGKVSIVDISGRMEHGPDMTLKDQVTELLEERHKNIVLNLNKVSFMDSTGLGELIRCLKRAKKEGGAIKLLNPREKVLNLLLLVKLEMLFEIYHDEKKVISSF